MYSYSGSNAADMNAAVDRGAGSAADTIAAAPRAAGTRASSSVWSEHHRHCHARPGATTEPGRS